MSIFLGGGWPSYGEIISLENFTLYNGVYRVRLSSGTKTIISKIGLLELLLLNLSQWIYKKIGLKVKLDKVLR